MMGTRSTLTVGREAALAVIRSALESGTLDNEALSEVMEAVSDGTGHRGSYNFRIVDGAGEDDGMYPAAPVPTFIPVHDEAWPSSEPTEFTLVLRWEGPNRIRTFALIRELRGLGLKETKAIIENLPAVLVEGVSREVADSWRRRFEAAGAIADIKPSWE